MGVRNRCDGRIVACQMPENAVTILSIKPSGDNQRRSADFGGFLASPVIRHLNAQRIFFNCATAPFACATVALCGLYQHRIDPKLCLSFAFAKSAFHLGKLFHEKDAEFSAAFYTFPLP